MARIQSISAWQASLFLGAAMPKQNGVGKRLVKAYKVGLGNRKFSSRVEVESWFQGHDIFLQ